MYTHNYLVALVLGCFLTVPCSDSRGEPIKYSIVHYTDVNGLPQNSVKGIVKDSLGFLWIATENGLVRFDGRQFYSYSLKEFPSASTRFFLLQHDPTGRPGYFAALTNEGKYFIIGNGKARYIDKPYIDNLPRFPGFRNYLQDLANRNTPHEYAFVRKCFYAVPDAGVRSLFFISGPKIVFYKDGKPSATIRYSSANFSRYFTLKNQLYTQAESGQVLRLDPKGVHPMTITGDLLNAQTTGPAARQIDIYWSQETGQLFAFDDHNVLYRLYPGENDTFKAQRILDGFNLEEHSINYIFQDDESRRIYMGSGMEGLFVASAQQFAIPQVGGETVNKVRYSQIAYDNDKVMASDGDILGLNTTGVLPRSYAISTHSSHHGIAMSKDNLNNIWGSNSFFSVYRFSPLGKSLLDTLITKDDTHSMFKDAKGDIWVGLGSGGLQHIEMKNDGFVSKPVYGYLPPVSFMIQKSSNTLWIGTFNGLFMFSIPDKKFVKISGTSHLNIRSLYQPDSQNLFISTYGHGLFHYGNNRLTQFPQDAEGFLNAAHCIIPDGNGYLWVPTNKGLFQLSKKELLQWASEIKPDWTPYHLYYDVTDGFETNEFNGGCQPCALRLVNGTVSLPSMRGFVWFHPETLRTELPSSDLIFDRVEVQGKRKSLERRTLMITQDDRQIDIYVATSYLGRSKNLEIDYAITTADEKSKLNWLSMNVNDPVIRFSSLAAGSYKIMVRKRLGFGKDNVIIKQLNIEVPPYWYETTWFRLLVLLTLVLATRFYMRWRTGNILKRNQELENRIYQRTLTLQTTMEQLQTSKQELSRQVSVRTHMMSAISHDIRTPIRYVVVATEYLEKLLVKYQDTEASEAATGIADSTRRVLLLLDNMISYIKSVYYDDQITISEIKLWDVLDEKQSLFCGIIEKQGNHLVFDVPANFTVKSNLPLLSIILHNLIDNANKFSFDNNIFVSASEENGEVVVSVRDSGPGFKTRQLKWLNAPFTGDKDLAVPNSRAGLGLVIVRELCSNLDIQLKARNDNGAVISLHFKSAITLSQPVLTT